MGEDAPAPVTFTTQVLDAGGTKAGIEVPDEVLEALGGGRRVPVVVTVGTHTWTSTTAVMAGRTLLGMSTENRRLAGVATGGTVEVTLRRETGPRQVAVPDDLATALEAEPGMRAAFDTLAPGYRKDHVVQVEGARTEATRLRRVQKVLDSLRGTP
ncbi:YdeI/OmpD-associated family protein [Aquipuribacter hungaricus]|uniref:YdeI/OmpD-associated family protein n=1 Tax=Aquipuribacter hungaricus TaxID=545624 RepID=A0ABV7WJ83_9MICO